jgi:hypothetical protein
MVDWTARILMVHTMLLKHLPRIARHARDPKQNNTHNHSKIVKDASKSTAMSWSCARQEHIGLQNPAPSVYDFQKTY